MHDIAYAVEVRWDGTTWVDITDDVAGLTIARGRTDDLSREQAGTCTIDLLDTDGRYAPGNAASPYAPDVLPMREVRVRATRSAVTYGLFRGFARRIESDPDPGARRATIEAVDLFLRLERAKPVLADAGATTTGAAIGRVLDALGWTDPALRALAKGDDIPTFAGDGATSGLALIQGLLATELGRFYIRGDGVAVFDGRHAWARGARAASQATIGGAIAAIAPGVDLDAIYNRATVTAGGGVPQTAFDAASEAEYQSNAYPAIASPYLASDNQALSLAKYVVSRRKDPLPLLRAVTLNAIVAAAREPLLARDLGDRITATDALTGASGDYHIERIEHRIDALAQRHTARWLVSRRAGRQPFRIGRSGIGGTDVITY